jgi:hypothetical protein
MAILGFVNHFQACAKFWHGNPKAANVLIQFINLMLSRSIRWWVFGFSLRYARQSWIGTQV